MAAIYDRIWANARSLISVMDSIYESINAEKSIGDSEFIKLCETRDKNWETRPTAYQCEDHPDFLKLSEQVIMLESHAQSMISLVRRGNIDLTDPDHYETFCHIGTGIDRAERFFGKG